MAGNPKPLTREQLAQVLTYDPVTGIFTRNSTGEAIVSKRVDAYVQIYVMHTQYLAAHLAWLWVYGEWPPKYIQHVNGVKTDDRIDNLQLKDFYKIAAVTDL